MNGLFDLDSASFSPDLCSNESKYLPSNECIIAVTFCVYNTVNDAIVMYGKWTMKAVYWPAHQPVFFGLLKFNFPSRNR